MSLISSAQVGISAIHVLWHGGSLPLPTDPVHPGGLQIEILSPTAVDLERRVFVALGLCERRGCGTAKPMSGFLFRSGRLVAWWFKVVPIETQVVLIICFGVLTSTCLLVCFREVAQPTCSDSLGRYRTGEFGAAAECTARHLDPSAKKAAISPVLMFKESDDWSSSLSQSESSLQGEKLEGALRTAVWP